MIAEDRVEGALAFMRDNAEDLANAVSRCKYLEQLRKAVKGEAFQEAEGTMAEREAQAYASPEHRDVCEQIKSAWYDAEILRTRYKAAELTIEVWRTQSSNNRKGMI